MDTDLSRPKRALPLGGSRRDGSLSEEARRRGTRLHRERHGGSLVWLGEGGKAP